MNASRVLLLVALHLFILYLFIRDARRHLEIRPEISINLPASEKDHSPLVHLIQRLRPTNYYGGADDLLEIAFKISQYAKSRSALLRSFSFMFNSTIWAKRATELCRRALSTPYSSSGRCLPFGILFLPPISRFSFPSFLSYSLARVSFGSLSSRPPTGESPRVLYSTCRSSSLFHSPAHVVHAVERATVNFT